MFRRFLNACLAPFRVILRFPAALISAPQRLLGMTLPNRVAVIVAVFLIVLSIVAGVVYLKRLGTSQFANWFTWVTALVILASWIIIPLIVRHAVKLLMEGGVSRFEDIDHAWREGMAALGKAGINLLRTPIILVIGARDAEQANAIFGASRLGFRVERIPIGNHALHWFASPEAIYLVCTDACRTSRLARKDRESKLSGAFEARPMDVAGGTDMTGTIMVGSSDARSPTPKHEPPPDRRALNATLQGMRGFEESSSSGDDARGAGIQGTMMLGGEQSPLPAAPSGGAKLSLGESAKQTAKLEYVCSLLSRARLNLCPHNGILALLPFELVQHDDSGGAEVAVALKEDLATIRSATQLRCPVTAFIVGMETEDGFTELVRRVGPKRAAEQRFGKGVGEGAGVWVPPFPALIEAVTDSACANFEAWTYELFKQKDGLTKPGNADLYTLLIKVRQVVRSRLTYILKEACGAESLEQEPLLFSGCYFAATGPTIDEQAFVQSVFRRVQQLDRELAWTRQARAADRFYRRLAWVGFGVSGVLAAACLFRFFL